MSRETVGRFTMSRAAPVLIALLFVCVVSARVWQSSLCWIANLPCYARDVVLVRHEQFALREWNHAIHWFYAMA